MSFLRMGGFTTCSAVGLNFDFASLHKRLVFVHTHTMFWLDVLVPTSRERTSCGIRGATSSEHDSIQDNLYRKSR